MTDEALARLALDIGTEAAALLLAGWQYVEPVDTKSTRHDLVTQMDRDSESLIRERLAAARTDDAVLGEEEGQIGDAGESGIRWVVDPLDGTVNYFYGHPNWAVSIAAERDGQIIAGAVIAPALPETYLAWQGGGAWDVTAEQPTRLAVSRVADLADALVGTGFGYDAERRGRQGQVAAQLLPQVRDLRRIGAAALDLCWVANGRLDAHYECGLNYWDWAAGGLIIAEAGGVTRDLAGGSGGTEMMVAGPPGLANQLAATLDRLGARNCL